MRPEAPSESDSLVEANSIHKFGIAILIIKDDKLLIFYWNVFMEVLKDCNVKRYTNVVAKFLEQEVFVFEKDITDSFKGYG